MPQPQAVLCANVVFQHTVIAHPSRSNCSACNAPHSRKSGSQCQACGTQFFFVAATNEPYGETLEIFGQQVEQRYAGLQFVGICSKEPSGRWELYKAAPRYNRGPGPYSSSLNTN